MTRLCNDPADFAQEATEGFAAAHRDRVRAVPGGVARRGETERGQVAVVIGGGTGHYPAFPGLVGAGLAHGAAVGEVFASPSAHRVAQVARAADGGAGVLLAYGNYAGDVLNFGQAAEQLTAEGIPTRTVAVTDDIAAAGPEEAHRRRGIAGDLLVFKAAAAAAERGATLDEVTRVAQHANARTRSFGVAFSGCALPGAHAPLFTVPEGRMAVGLGIHGEPGIGEEPLPSADTVAERLTCQLLAELPQDVSTARGQRVGLVLNGLGALAYEELFVVHRRVAQLLEADGVDVVEPEVGQVCTSFDMAGLSLSLLWLDEELEELWRASADAPAFRRGTPTTPTTPKPDLSDSNARDEPDTTTELGKNTVPPATAESRQLAGHVLDTLSAVRSVLDAHAEELGRIDAIAGDGDHGIGMRHGIHGACAAAADTRAARAGTGTVLLRAGDGWADRAGGTSGALWRVMLRSVGEAVGDQDGNPEARTVAAGCRAAAEAVIRLGKAEVGDKTLVDVLVPFARTLDDAAQQGASLSEAWRTAATAARQAADATATLVPRAGRARTHADRSLGTPDAGAHSLALVIETVGAVPTGTPVGTGDVPPGTPHT